MLVRNAELKRSRSRHCQFLNQPKSHLHRFFPYSFQQQYQLVILFQVGELIQQEKPVILNFAMLPHLLGIAWECDRLFFFAKADLGQLVFLRKFFVLYWTISILSPAYLKLLFLKSANQVHIQVRHIALLLKDCDHTISKKS